MSGCGMSCGRARMLVGYNSNQSVEHPHAPDDGLPSGGMLGEASNLHPKSEPDGPADFSGSCAKKSTASDNGHNGHG